MDLLLDSNTCIDYIALKLPETSTAIIKSSIKELVFVSVITRIEVFGFNGSNDEMSKQKDLFVKLLQIDMSENIVQKTISLRKQYPKIKLPDLIIAATALEYNLTLVTHNLNDFKNIQGLKIIDSHLL